MGAGRGEFPFPAVAGDQVWGVLEFFSCESRPLDHELVEQASAIGNVLGNVAERLRTRRELEASLKRFRDLFELIPIPAAVSTLVEGRFAEVNRAYQTGFGYSKEEMIGRTSVKLGILLPGFDRTEFNRGVEVGMLETVREIELPPGHPRTILARVQLIDWRGEQHLLSSFIDLTQWKKAEALAERRREQVSALVGMLITGQEQERARISRELHDHVGQTPSVTQLNLRSLFEGPESDESTMADETIRLLNEVLEHLRTLSLELRPTMIEELGLGITLRSLATRHAELVG